MNKSLILIILVLFVGCNTNKNILNVQNINDVKTYNQTGFIYNLPKTKIFIVVEVEKIVQSKGPYSEFSDKYLGSLKNSIKENRTYYNLSDVQFISAPIPDSSQTYFVSNTVAGLQYGFNLTKDGFLISVNLPEIDFLYKEYEIFGNNNDEADNDNITFNLLTSDKNYRVIYDTVYREEVYDTIIKKIPILKKNIILKTPEEQAKELAEQIHILRDDKAALLVGEGDSDYLPEGDALQIMLQGIDALEKEYLSMFIGKTDTLKYTYTFSYVPEKNDFQKTIVLFKFSANSGVLPADNVYGNPVNLEIEADNFTKNIKDFQQNQFYTEKVHKKKYNSGLFYRIPQNATFRIIYNSHIISQKNIFVAQLGTTAYLPAEIFNNSDLRIEFYPELGSIKKISIK